MKDECKWRACSSDFIEIGETLAEIKEDFRHVRATAATSDVDAAAYVDNALRSSRRLTRALDRLFRTITRES